MVISDAKLLPYTKFINIILTTKHSIRSWVYKANIMMIRLVTGCTPRRKRTKPTWLCAELVGQGFVVSMLVIKTKFLLL